MGKLQWRDVAFGLAKSGKVRWQNRPPFALPCVLSAGCDAHPRRAGSGARQRRGGIAPSAITSSGRRLRCHRPCHIQCALPALQAFREQCLTGTCHCTRRSGAMSRRLTPFISISPPASTPTHPTRASQSNLAASRRSWPHAPPRPVPRHRRRVPTAAQRRGIPSCRRSTTRCLHMGACVSV